MDGMFSKPSTHVVIRPGPIERMGIELVIFRPSGLNMIDQRLTAIAGVALQVMVTERIIEQFGLIEPGGMDRCEARSPPGMAFL